MARSNDSTVNIKAELQRRREQEKAQVQELNYDPNDTPAEASSLEAEKRKQEVNYDPNDTLAETALLKQQLKSGQLVSDTPSEVDDKEEFNSLRPR